MVAKQRAGPGGISGRREKDMTVYIRAKRDGHEIEHKFIGSVSIQDGEIKMVKDPRISLTVGTIQVRTADYEITGIMEDMLTTPEAVKSRTDSRDRADRYITEVFR